MKLGSIALFSVKRDYWLAAILIAMITLLSLAFEWYRYKQFTQFDDAVEKATVLLQYTRHKDDKSYQVLKLKLENSNTFYTTADTEIRDLTGYEIEIWIKTDQINFLAYLKGFFTYSRIISVSREKVWRYQLSDTIALQHEESSLQEIYGALFGATPMGASLRSTLSSLGISHLLAISGFHLGVLSMLLFALFRLPYRFLQQRYFPYRHANRDLFLAVSVVLLGYLVFLGMPPSLLRAFAMLMIGFLLYDRGMKVVSMQTLLLTVLLLLALWPGLFFSMGFWLSVSGVFYIFLFLIHFGSFGRWQQFIGVHFWVYIMMLPLSLALFETFSAVHPFSIAATMAFIVFYPLVLGLHLLGWGELLDDALSYLLFTPIEPVHITLSLQLLIGYILLSLFAVRSKIALIMLMLFSITVLVGAVYQVA